MTGSIWLKLGFFAVIGLVLAWQNYELKAARAQRDLALERWSLAEAQADRWARSALLSAAALAEREASVNELAAEREKLLEDLETLYGQTCETAAWADTPVPGPVLERLRRPLPPPGPGPSAAGRADAERARTAAPRAD